MKAKKIIILCVVVLFFCVITTRFWPTSGKILALTMASCTNIEPGYVGIKVNQHDHGPNDFYFVTGRVGYNPFIEKVYRFPTFLQNVVWAQGKTAGSPNDKSITFSSREGVVINADIAINYGFVSEKISTLYAKFRQSPKDIINVYLWSKVQDYFNVEASQYYGVVDIVGQRKQALLNQVKDDLERELGPEGFYFDMISFIGKLRVDINGEKIINASMNNWIKYTEDEFKIELSKIEAAQSFEKSNGRAKSILVIAKAQAQANKLISASLTPQLIKWQTATQWYEIIP